MKGTNDGSYYTDWDLRYIQPKRVEDMFVTCIPFELPELKVQMWAGTAKMFPKYMSQFSLWEEHNGNDINNWYTGAD